MVHRMDGPVRPDWRPLPGVLPAMLPTPAKALPRNAGQWSFETDWPGERVLAHVDGGRVRLTSDGGAELTSLVPELRALGEALGLTQVLLDGTLVAFDDAGRPDADRLAKRLRSGDPRAAARRTPVVLLVSDVLHLDGRPTTALPFAERRELLEGLDLRGPAWQTSPAFPGDGRALLAAAREQGLPGVLAKRLDSPYRPGRRDPAWRAVPAERRGPA